MDISAQLIQSLKADPAPEPTVTVIGDLGYDYIYTSPPLEGGKEIIITEASRTIAGAAGYLACGLARLGARVYLLTELGNDTDGLQLLAEISERGVETEGIRVLENTRSYYTLIFADREELTPRQVATYLGPLDRLSIRNFDYRRFITASQLVYSCNYFQLLTVRGEIAEVFSYARNADKRTVYDANAGDGWEEAGNLDLLRDCIYPHTNVVFLNEREAQFLTGEKNTLQSVMKASPSSEIVVVKRGSAGVVLREGERVYHCPAFPLSDSVKDTVGAGDSFQAAFLYVHLKGFPILDCTILGAANAASTAQHPGGVIGQLDRAGLADMLGRYTIGIQEDSRVEISMNDR